ncbi:hypothetical protein ACFSHT_00755 [Paraburkholderia silviterrae]|uniref:hypothetical protein n=1 Tax=Paraburkholderia silviterrae TaxID=2528715 RepID=UPI001F0FBDA7|nr:hypothetical protein [Paraburkholderia silviterrae]
MIGFFSGKYSSMRCARARAPYGTWPARVALLAQAWPLGIKVTCVEPGPFRTDRAGRSLVQTPNRIADDADTAGARMKRTAEGRGKQAGDLARAAQAMIRITEVGKPPRHLVLGAFGVDAVSQRLRAALADTEAWRETSLGTDFPAGT